MVASGHPVQVDASLWCPWQHAGSRATGDDMFPLNDDGRILKGLSARAIDQRAVHQGSYQGVLSCPSSSSKVSSPLLIALPPAARDGTRAGRARPAAGWLPP